MPLGGRRLAYACATQVLMWALIAINYAQNVLWRQPSWGPATHLAGHLLLVLFALSWAMTMCATPMMLPPEWSPSAPGNEVDKRTGTILPPRAYLSHGQIILGFDHFCGWLGVPIGLHNRKFFVLMLLYGALLCGFAGGLSMHDYTELASASDSGDRPSVGRALLLFLSPGVLLAHASKLAAASIELYLALADSLATAALTFFFAQHARLVWRNSVTVESNFTRAPWDVGGLANVRQVFGAQAAWWLVPVGHRWGAGPTVNGVDWPEREANTA